MLTSAAVTGTFWALGDSADAQPDSDVVGAAWLVRLAPGAADGITVTWQGRLRDDEDIRIGALARISRVDLADVMLQQLGDQGLVRRAVAVS